MTTESIFVLDACNANLDIRSYIFDAKNEDISIKNWKILANCRTYR